MATRIGNVQNVERRIVKRISAYSPSDPRFTRLLFRIGMILQQEGQISYHSSGLKRRTGTLANSMQARIKRTRLGGRVDFAPWGVPYAAIHEFGGTIHQQRGEKSVRINIPRREYLRPALRNSVERIRFLFEDGIE